MTNRLVRWARRHRFLTVLLVLLLAITPAFVVVQIDQQRQAELIGCVTDWGDAVADRTEYLSEPFARLDAATDAVIRSVAAEDPEAFRAALAEYIAASDALNAAREAQPPPERPSLQCHR
jgi:hypothetical protein